MTRIYCAAKRFGRAALMAMLAAALGLMVACGGGVDDAGADVIEFAEQPSSADVSVGDSVNFRVSAVGAGLSYQWQRSTDDGAAWTDIAGATGPTFGLSAANLSDDQHQYRVMVSGPGGSWSASMAAVLGVSSHVRPASILVQPEDQHLAEGEAAVYAVTASGTSLRYQWQVDLGEGDWIDVPGATDSMLKLGPVALAESGKRYRALVSNRAGIVETEAAALEIEAKEADASTTAAAGTPVILRQPAATTVVAPELAKFSVAARGSPTPTYQWQLSTDGGSTYRNIALATGTSYTTPATKTSDSGRRYRVRVSNSAGSALTSAAVLTVAAVARAPSIASQPSSKTVTAPAAVSFSVVATGAPSPSYQWQVSADGGQTYTSIVGATGSTYRLAKTSTADTGNRFRVRVTNRAGRVFSKAAVLTVLPTPAFVYTANAGTTVITGYAVRRATGAFVATPGSPYAGPTSAYPLLALHPNGRFLYAAELNQPRTWVYLVDPSTGRLTLTAGSPYTTPNVALLAPVVDPSGRFLIFKAGFQLASYAIDPANGGLTSTGTLLFSMGSSSLEFSKDSKFIFVQDGNSQLRVLKTNPLTLLTDASTIVPIVSGTRFYFRSGYLLAQQRNFGLTSFAVNASGALTPVQSLAGFGPNIVAHRNGQCLYMSGSVSGNAPSQSVTFTPVVLNPTTGALTAKPQVRIPVPASINISEYPLLANPGGAFGYLSQLEDFLKGNITPVALNGTACTITAGTPFDPGVLQQNVRFDTSGSLLFNFLTGVPSLFVSKIDPITRVPTQVTGSPITTSGPTKQVVTR